MSTFILNYFDKISIVVFAIFGLIAFSILRRNNQLSSDNKDLKQAISGANEMLTINTKLLDAIQNTDPKPDRAGTLDRLYKEKL